jgi:hypothetical protein
VIVGKVVVHICLTLIIKELKISVEQDRVVTTQNIIYSVVSGDNGARLCRARPMCNTTFMVQPLIACLGATKNIFIC